MLQQSERRKLIKQEEYSVKWLPLQWSDKDEHIVGTIEHQSADHSDKLRASADRPEAGRWAVAPRDKRRAIRVVIIRDRSPNRRHPQPNVRRQQRQHFKRQKVHISPPMSSHPITSKPATVAGPTTVASRHAAHPTSNSIAITNTTSNAASSSSDLAATTN